MKPLIYVAGAYTSDPVHNTRKAIRFGEQIEKLGCDVHIPHLTIIWDLVSPAPCERFYERDNAILVRCDAVFRMSGVSAGADAEVALALDHSLPVFYNLSTLADWAEEFRTHRREGRHW